MGRDKPKIFFILAVLGMMMVMIEMASADGYPAGGMIEREVPADTVSITEQGIAGFFRKLLLADSVLSGPGTCVTGTEYSWELTDRSASAASNYYQISVTVVDGTYANPETADVQYLPKRSRSQTLSYTFYFPGNYVVFADVFDSEGASEVLFTKSIRVTVTDGGRNDVTDMIQSVAAQYQSEDEFETVLSLHDWVIDHCEYDHDLIHYGAESLFLEGIGVCNSYTRALVLLLEEAGISCRRVAGFVNGNPNSGHAWVAAEIDGEWYLIDPTWDDQSDVFLRRAYFAVNEELLNINHTATNYTDGLPRPAFTALESNWFVHEDKWLDYTTEMVADYTEKMATGWHRFKLSAPVYPTLSGAYGRTMLGTVTAYAMSHTEWEYAEGKSCTGSFSYQYDKDEKKGYITGKHTSAGTLKLPWGLERIEEEAFSDADANIVVIWDNCEYVGPGAFSGMDIWELAVGSDEMTIEPDAFDDDFVYVIASPDSSIAAYAEEVGWVVGDGTDFE